MKRHFVIIISLSVIFLLSFDTCFSQRTWDFAKEAKGLAATNNKATVKGFAFDKTINPSKDSLNKGFTIELEDTSYKIQYFILTYECEGCEIWEKVIFGKNVTIENAPILKSLKKGELLIIGSFKVEKRKAFYTIPETAIILTD